MATLDHLVLGVPDLEQGMALVEARTGVRPVFGGQHPGRGTHNALLALGGRQYLEIIAMDPAQKDASGLLFAELATLAEPRFIGWAVAVDSIAAAAARAGAARIATVGPLPGARAQADGRMLTWQTLRIADPAPVAGLPFFIAWRPDSAHPSQNSPAGCTLAGYAIEHPDPERFAAVLASLDVTATVSRGPTLRLKARLQTPKGAVQLL